MPLKINPLSTIKNIVKYFFEINPKYFFYGILLIVFLLSLRGLHWGVTKSWNPDQMAFKNLFILPENQALNPQWFLKPPFFTYIVYFLIVLPVSSISMTLGLSLQTSLTFQLFFAQLLVLLLFLGSALLVFTIVKQNYNEKVASIIGILFVSSAGFIAFLPFLTVDLPLMFFCIVAFYYCQKIITQQKFSTYILAGFFVGIATATKYNGLLVAPCLITAHFLKSNFSLNQLFKNIFSLKLTSAVLAIFIGFIIANPYSVITPNKFLIDFHYILVTDTLYETRPNPQILFDHLISIKEIIGWPSLVFLLSVFVTSLFEIKKIKNLAKLNKNYLISLISLAFIMPFSLFMSSYNTSYTRYFVPFIPFLFIFSTPFWSFLTKGKKYYFTFSLVLLVVAYNLVSMHYVGSRFIFDSRMKALEWAQVSLQSKKSIENSSFMPTWDNYSSMDLVEYTMPSINSSFNEVEFPSLIGNQKLVERSKKVEGTNQVMWYPREWYSTEWYSREGLNLRNPDYISLNSWHFLILKFGWFQQKYPDIVNYYQDLLAGRLGYQVVFEENSLPPKQYLYPTYIIFMDSKTIILKKE